MSRKIGHSTQVDSIQYIGHRQVGISKNLQKIGHPLWTFPMRKWGNLGQLRMFEVVPLTQILCNTVSSKFLNPRNSGTLCIFFMTYSLLNTKYLTDSYISFTLKLESRQKFCSKSLIRSSTYGKKIISDFPPCGKMVVFVTEFVIFLKTSK